jgi:Fur family peroxide stress response transcriptional regulator
MADPQDRYDHLIAKLKDRNYRLTIQRVRLVRLIAESTGHPSASQLYQQIKSDLPSMSQATVYKTLTLLKELGEVLEIDLKDDSHYDGNKPYPHPHLICTRCRLIIDGEPGSSIQQLVSDLENSSGYQIVRHQMDFYGLCPACQEAG